MFDLSFTEIAIVVVVALVVLKPEDLPEILRMFGRVFNKLKTLAREFNEAIEDVAKETGVDEMHKELKEIVDLEGNRREAHDTSDLKDLARNKD